MPTPTLITDLSTTAASNYPAGTDSPGTLDDVQRAHGAFIAQLRDGKGFINPVTLASSTTTDIGGQNSPSVEISGTTAITSFGTNYNGPRFLRFTGALTLTHSATLSLPGSANIITAAGDTAIAVPNQALNGWNVYAFSKSPAQSMVRLNTANGYGSTNTMIRRFTTTVTNQGADITYADSATLGASFTVNTAGVYAISYSDSFSGASNMGVSLNTTTPTTQIGAIAANEVLCIAVLSTAAFGLNTSATVYLPAGSVIRAHAQAVATSGFSSQFTIVKVA